jgi:hypothetical protein
VETALHSDRATLFAAGSMVLATLGSPREKFWGALLELSPLGLTLRGIDLQSFDDFARQLKCGEPVSPAVVFFPMHRLERVELDAPSGDLPSLAEQFRLKSGRAVEAVFSFSARCSGGAV